MVAVIVLLAVCFTAITVVTASSIFGQQRAGQDGTAAAEPLREALLQALFELEHGERSDPRRWPAACAPAGTAGWQRHDRAVTPVA